MIIATYIFKEKIKVAFNDVRNAVSNLNSFVQEHLTGMNIVQIFGSEKREFERFKDINREHRDANLRSVLYYSVYFPVAEIISAMGIGLLVWYGAKGVINQAETGITLGTLIAVIMYIQMFFRPIRMIADRYNTLQMGIVATSRIMTLMDDTEHVTVTGGYRPERWKGEVKFDRVWFAYNDGEYVLKDISIDIKPGETVALVGATGAGKSSIINLLNRFYEIHRGAIYIDSVNISEFDLALLAPLYRVWCCKTFSFSPTLSDTISPWVILT